METRVMSSPSKLRGATTGHTWPSAIRENSHERAVNDRSVPQLWCYTDRLSYQPGDTISFHLSGTGKRIGLAIIRDGGSEVVCHRHELDAGFHETPDQCSVTGCGWPASYSLTIPDDWRSGGYRVHVTSEMPDGTPLAHDTWFALRAGRVTGDLLQIAATSTWLAYNDWGGSNHYEGICGPNRDQPAPVVSLDRPWARGFCHLPPGAPRTVLSFAPPPGAPPRYPHMEWAFANGYSKKYASSGWATYDRHFSVWAERNGYRVDMATQHDLHLLPDLLDRYRCAVIVGHDEYWSWEMRDAIDRFVDRGGHLVRLGGNFLLQVRLEDDGRRQVCYQGRDGDPVAGTEKAHLQTTYWDGPVTGRPGVTTMGLSGLRGIYANVGMCTPRGSRGFTVYRPDHWAFAGTDLQYGDLLGNESRIFGYEVDGVDYTFRHGLPYPSGADPVPDGLEILAMGVATNVEARRGFDAADLFLGDDSAHFARMLYGSDSPEHVARTRYGSGMIASFHKGKGEVFNAATTEWVHGLMCRDAAVETITRNVLERACRRS
jgi:N,N-dimethylformamidase beta subunit-like, C-terminal